jgi:hypothetical protein
MADFQPIGITKVVDKPSPTLHAPIPPPDIPTNPIFVGGAGGAVVNHLFNPHTETIGLLGVSPPDHHLG